MTSPPAPPSSGPINAETAPQNNASAVVQLQQSAGELVGDHGIFAVLRHTVTPTTPERAPFHVHTLRMPDWVTVVAQRQDQRLVLVKQHRFGVDAPTLETPGGMIDAGEAPQFAAQRELREETGHSSARWESLGWVHPNPAVQGNRIHFWLAREVAHRDATDFDEHEHVETVLWTPARVRRALNESTITHALSALALERALRLL